MATGSATVKAVALIAGGPNVKGSVHFFQDATGATHVTGRIAGLSPGLHGFHIHAFGDTTNGCISTGPHFNPLKRNHGARTDEDRHAGDLGNIFTGQDGVAEIRLDDLQVKSLNGRNCIHSAYRTAFDTRKSFVVHADPDDLGRGPYGATSERVKYLLKREVPDEVNSLGLYWGKVDMSLARQPGILVPESAVELLRFSQQSSHVFMSLSPTLPINLSLCGK